MIKAAQLRQAILQSAVQGKLVPQNPHDEPASVLLERIRVEKVELIKAGKLRKEKPLLPIMDDEIPYDLPEGWNWSKLGEITQKIHYGYTASAAPKGNAKLLRITDIQNNKVDWQNVPYCTIENNRLNDYQLNNQDILIARTGGTIGKTYLVADIIHIAVFASYLIRIVPFSFYNIKYLKYYLESPLYWGQLHEKSMGTGQPNVNGVSLSNLFVPLPPMAEQQRIVAKVEELMAMCNELEAAEKELDTLEEHFIEYLPKSILQAAVQGKLVPQNIQDEPASVLLECIRAEKAKLIKEGKLKKEKLLPPITEDETPFDIPENWTWCRLGDIHSIHRGITFPASVKGNEQTKGCVCCATTGSVQEVYNPRADVFVPEKYVKNQDQWLLNNDIIMSTANSRELVGKTCFWKGKERKTFGGFLTVIRACGDIPVKYSYYVLQYLWKTGAFVTTSTQTTNIANINNSILVSTVIPLPPLAEQRHIVAKVDELMALCGELKTVEKAIDASEPKQTTIMPLGKSQENEPLKMVARGDMDLGISEEARQDVDELFNDI